MKRVAPLLLILLVPLVATAQVRVKGETVYKPFDPIILRATDADPKAQYLWDISEGAQVEEAGGTLYVWAPPGTYKVSLISVNFDTKKIDRARFSFKVSEDVPTPPGPNPPGPTPTPVAGLRVLIVEEAMERTKLPAAQVLVILGQPMRDYLNKVCMADPAASSGKSWGIWDKDSDASGMPQPWQVMFAKGKTLTMPAIVIAGPDGTPVYSGPLPADVAATQALINRYVPASIPAKRKAA